MVSMMTKGEAAKVLRKYNEWRMGEHGPCDPQNTPREIGEAIDVAVETLEQISTSADIDSIMQSVARETGVTEEEMLARGRHREYTEARAMVCWLTYHCTSMSLTSIGRRLDRDHATMIHYNQMVDGWLEEPRRNLRGARIVTALRQEIEQV